MTDKEAKVDNVLYLEHGQPMRFGKDLSKGLRLGPGGDPEVVGVASSGTDGLLVHDEKSRVLPHLLAELKHPEFPVPLGVLRDVEAPCLDQDHHAQIDRARAANKQSLQQLLTGHNSWTVR